MRSNHGFYDLCVNTTDSPTLQAILTKEYSLGYRTIGINTTINDSLISERKKRKLSNKAESQKQLIPLPPQVTLQSNSPKDLKILTRITLACSDPSSTHTLNHSSVLKQYDLFAISPETQAALQFACSQLNVDIISLQHTRAGLKLNKKLYEQAVERGIAFEIILDDLLDCDKRQLAIHYSHLFHTYGKSRNVIISSGAKFEKRIREPYSVITLGLIMGLSEEKARAAILDRCRTLILRAERRRYGKSVFAIKDRSFLESNNE